MSKVVSLDDRRPHNSGPAKCLGCQHNWHAIVPADVHDYLECPECGLYKGEFASNCEPAEGEEIFTCSCGCDLFYVLRDGLFCRHCGDRKPFDLLGHN